MTTEDDGGATAPRERTIDDKFRDIDAIERGARRGEADRLREARRLVRAADEGGAYDARINDLDVADEFAFESVASSCEAEAPPRRELVARGAAFGVSFLDDAMRALLPTDLVLIGADTGAGKTEIATIIGSSNARAGRRVGMFALEAEQDEIARRLIFRETARLLAKDGLRERMAYIDWYLGAVSPQAKRYEEIARKIVAQTYENLHVHYRGRSFTALDYERLMKRHRVNLDVMVLDHLHVIDSDDANEMRGQKSTIKTIRDSALDAGIAVIAVSHLRKRDRNRAKMPGLEDFHGSSDIVKMATHAVMLTRGDAVDGWPGYIVPTLIEVAKDRRSGASKLVARIGFDLRTNSYAVDYEIGRMVDDEFVALMACDVPTWAKHATNGGAR